MYNFMLGRLDSSLQKNRQQNDKYMKLVVLGNNSKWTFFIVGKLAELW
jgi:hypothetical protein